jgi:hypothetical protein
MYTSQTVNKDSLGEEKDQGADVSPKALFSKAIL